MSYGGYGSGDEYKYGGGEDYSKYDGDNVENYDGDNVEDYNKYDGDNDGDYKGYGGDYYGDFPTDQWNHPPPTPEYSDVSGEATIEECKIEMKTKDFIMEPAVLPCVKRFKEAGGLPGDFIDLLADNYHGTAQIANLLADWLIVAGSSVEEVQEVVENHLKNLIIKNFDQKKADSIFSGEPPSWIEEMIAYKPWRVMLYELSDKHPDCLMLNFTIKLIADAGYQSEIGSMSSACNQLEIFSKILQTSITNYFNRTTSTADFVKVCCHSKQLYMYTQCLLHALLNALTSQYERVCVMRLINDLEEGAIQSGRDTWHVKMVFVGGAKHPRVMSSLLSLAGRHALNPGDITVLYKSYSSDDPPPVVFLQLPTILDLLTSAIFVPEGSISSEHKEKYTYLLAYAASVHELWSEGERDSVQRDELKATLAAIERVHLICASDVGVTSSQLNSHVALLFQSLRYPVVSMGLIKWIEFCLSEKNYLKVVTEVSPIQILLLDEISNHHPLHLELILELLQTLFLRNYPELDTLLELEFKKSIVERLVHVVSKGHVIPVVQFIGECMRTQQADISLLRHFVVEMLEMIGPPYSQEFISVFLPIVLNEEISSHLKTADKNDDISKFIAHCES